MNLLIASRRCWWKLVQCALGVVGVTLMLNSSTSAQNITAQQLLQNAVDAPGNYPDVDDAITRFRNRDFAGAKQLLDRARSSHPELPPSGVLLGQLFLAANQANLARETLEGVVKSDPSDPEPFLVFGELAFRGRRFADAGLLYEKANELAQSFSGSNAKRKTNLQLRALSGLAGVAQARADWQTALRHFQAMDALSPNNADVQAGLARSHFELGDESKAYELFGKIWNANREGTRAEVRMGLLYYRAKNKQRAASLFKHATDRGSNSLRTQLEVANWALEANELELAKTAVDRAMKLDPNSVDANLLAGLAARFDRDYPAAETAFEKAHLLRPASFQAVKNLALSLIEQVEESKRVRALEYAQLLSSANSDLQQTNGREAGITLGWILFRLGREVEAERAVAQVVRVGGAISPEGAYYAARIYQGRGQPQTARQILGPALRQTAAFPSRRDAEDLLNRLPPG